jgi:hypothetical protein
LTSSLPFSNTASEAPSIQLLEDLNPGNEVPLANQSDQNAANHEYVEEVLDHESNSDDDDDIGLEELMQK